MPDTVSRTYFGWMELGRSSCNTWTGCRSRNGGGDCKARATPKMQMPPSQESKNSCQYLRQRSDTKNHRIGTYYYWLCRPRRLPTSFLHDLPSIPLWKVQVHGQRRRSVLKPWSSRAPKPAMKFPNCKTENPVNSHKHKSSTIAQGATMDAGLGILSGTPESSRL